jgi:hypothetical protein
MVQSIEEWRILPINTEYEVSNLGNVRSIKDYYDSTFKGIPVRRKKKTSLVGPKLSKKGYCRVNLNGITHPVHRLIASAFIPNPNNFPQVNHKNGIKTDNRVENLEWVTNLENRIHAIENNLIARGEQCEHKLTEKEVLEIYQARNSGVFQKDIASKYGVCQQTISSVQNRKTWRHILND